MPHCDHYGVLCAYTFTLLSWVKARATKVTRRSVANWQWVVGKVGEVDKLDNRLVDKGASRQSANGGGLWYSSGEKKKQHVQQPVSG